LIAVAPVARATTTWRIGSELQAAAARSVAKSWHRVAVTTVFARQELGAASVVGSSGREQAFLHRPSGYYVTAGRQRAACAEPSREAEKLP
jgi:hypothetical protein